MPLIAVVPPTQADPLRSRVSFHHGIASDDGVNHQCRALWCLSFQSEGLFFFFSTTTKESLAKRRPNDAFIRYGRHPRIVTRGLDDR